MSRPDQPPRMEPDPAPIDRITRPIGRFLHLEAASGIVLLVCTAVALLLSNSDLADGFLEFWNTPVGFEFGRTKVEHSLQHWINDGLMAVFFFVVGLEVKRELVVGELREPRRAVLPLVAALGGMVVPAGIYLLLAGDGDARRGWGIPMATDIAFVVGCMAILGRRVPAGLRTMLLALAVADDIGAILVIAIGYTDHIDLRALGVGAAGIAAIAAAARLGVRAFGVYVLLGLVVWMGFHASGVHATIAGVILGLLTPARPMVGSARFDDLLLHARSIFAPGAWEAAHARPEQVRVLRLAVRETISPLEYLQSLLHPWVGFVIMPLFALANAGVPITGSGLEEPVALAVGVGLLAGKPIGIVVFSAAAVGMKLAQLPSGVTWRQMIGAGFLAGIGFTMALFIAGLALRGDELDAAKVGILAGSAVAATIGMLMLVVPARPPVTAST